MFGDYDEHVFVETAGADVVDDVGAGFEGLVGDGGVVGVYADGLGGRYY